MIKRVAFIGKASANVSSMAMPLTSIARLRAAAFGGQQTSAAIAAIAQLVLANRRVTKCEREVFIAVILQLAFDRAVVIGSNKVHTAGGRGGDPAVARH